MPSGTHGTSIGTLIAAEVGAGPTVGVCPACRLLPVEVQASGGRFSLPPGAFRRAIEYLAPQVDVLLLSWTRFPYFVLSQEEQALLKRAASVGGRRGRGIVIVCAAGNSSCPINHAAERELPYAVLERGHRPTLARSRTFRNTLTAIPEVLHVAAINSLAQRAAYSCYGPGIDLCAPSDNRDPLTTEKLPGLGVVTTYGTTEVLVTERLKGTSAAGAIVAGVAALVIAVDPSLTAAEVGAILAATASRSLVMTQSLRCTDNLFAPEPPFDRGNFSRDGWSPWFGHGKVDASAAVQAAAERSRPRIIGAGPDI